MAEVKTAGRINQVYSIWFIFPDILKENVTVELRVSQTIYWFLFPAINSVLVRFYSFLRKVKTGVYVSCTAALLSEGWEIVYPEAAFLISLSAAEGEVFALPCFFLYEVSSLRSRIT